VWDTVGEDQTLKGEYRVISGRMCVHVTDIVPIFLIGKPPETIWNGMGRANESSPWVTDGRSEQLGL